MTYRIEIVVPQARSRRARILARDLEGRILRTFCANLMDVAGRRRVARDLCQRLGGDCDFSGSRNRRTEWHWATGIGPRPGCGH
jgi:hypothetical protein